MPTPSRHFKEELQDLLDARLDPAARSVVEEHLEVCDECQRELAALRWTKNFAAQHFAVTNAPADLEASIVQALRADGAQARSEIIRPAIWQSKGRVLLAWAAAVAVAALVAGSYFLFRPSLPASLARNYQAYEAQTLALEMTTRDVKQMEIYFHENDVRFATRVFDLAMMNYDLVGGRVQRLRGEKSALFVYRGKGNHPLLCQMYEGRPEDLPAGAIRREHKGIMFYRYQIKGLTVVFWPEGGVMCALVSDIAPEKVVDLAFAKAGPML
ncbi:MAG: zf-HC2 domain-containing protein [Spartobacteria bacterium]